MVLYRRNRVAGASYFFTINLADRSARTLVEHVALLRESFHEVRQRRPFKTIAIVVLPGHLHAVWKLPESDDDFPTRWRAIKASFTRKLNLRGVRLPTYRNGEFALWQRRFWEHTIRDESDLEQHVNYIHYNPVKHGHASTIEQWPHSSFHRYVRLKILPRDWGGGAREASGRYGE